MKTVPVVEAAAAVAAVAAEAAAAAVVVVVDPASRGRSDESHERANSGTREARGGAGLSRSHRHVDIGTLHNMMYDCVYSRPLPGADRAINHCTGHAVQL